MLEALDNLPEEFAKKDGIIDLKNQETIAAIDEAVKLFMEYNDLNPNDDDDKYNDDEYDDED